MVQRRAGHGHHHSEIRSHVCEQGGCHAAEVPMGDRAGWTDHYLAERGRQPLSDYGAAGDFCLPPSEWQRFATGEGGVAGCFIPHATFKTQHAILAALISGKVFVPRTIASFHLALALL